MSEFKAGTILLYKAHHEGEPLTEDSKGGIPYDAALQHERGHAKAFLEYFFDGLSDLPSMKSVLDTYIGKEYRTKAKAKGAVEQKITELLTKKKYLIYSGNKANAYTRSAMKKHEANKKIKALNGGKPYDYTPTIGNSNHLTWKLYKWKVLQ